MNKQELKINLVQIFAETKKPLLNIDDQFIEKYKKIFWTNFIETCKSVIARSGEFLTIDKWFVNTHSLNVDRNMIDIERPNIHKYMLPIFTEWLKNCGIIFTVNESGVIIILIKDLKELSNAECLGTLL